MVDGYRLVAEGYRLVVDGYRLVVVCCWLMVDGY